MSGMNTAPYQAWAKETLGYEFKDVDLLVTAFTHRSYVNEHRKSARQHNERLEFLGDAVLELVVTSFLFQKYTEPEGILTAWRSALVRTESICEAGEELGYDALLRMSKGERAGSESARKHIVANAFEALIGAVYLEKGYKGAEKIINARIISKIDEILATGSWRDPKSYLQELSQKHDDQTPDYKVLEEEGPDHDKQFTVGVYVRDKKIGSGVGPSKQKAQSAAAEQGIMWYNKEHGQN
ncbi:ribonuclease III [Candidatus Saccharibacteria bacterium]|jgi:ribonuclease-3|nr:ribonuclease III [Candidatus Saccharibacteria bacterium]